MSETYDPQRIEQKWQRVWRDAHADEVENPVDPASASEPKSYVLEMLPYPSGSLHMGHMLVYTIGDVVTRFRRRNGLRVLHPMGWDAFGLPAENAAIRGGGHPREMTERHIGSIRRSMQRAGWSYDWTRELSTHDPHYYRWQQWQFLRFLEQGLAYRKGAPVKWCPNDQTVLANEQVLPDGTCERCGAVVESRVMEQWFFRITDYADALLDDLETVDWPESIKARQRNWIGRSEGAEIDFRIEEWDEDVTVFPTRASAPRSSCSRPSTSSWPGSRLTTSRPTSAAPARRRPRSGRPRRRRPASSPACTRSTRSTTSRSPSTWPTMCSPTTARAQSWPCPHTTSATSTSRRHMTCPFAG